MALVSTQPVVKMSTRNIPGGKDGRCARLTTYHHTVPLSWNLGTSTSWNPLGLHRPVMGELYFTLCVVSINWWPNSTKVYLSVFVWHIRDISGRTWTRWTLHRLAAHSLVLRLFPTSGGLSLTHIYSVIQNTARHKMQRVVVWRTVCKAARYDVKNPTCGRTRFVQVPHLADRQRVMWFNLSLQNIYKIKYEL